MKALNALFTILLAFIFIVNSNATVWTVDSNPGNHAANFTDVQAAHDAAADGDTLYLSGFNVSYGDVTITKKMYIFGPGFYLNQNDSTQANTYAAITGDIFFQAGSENSVIAGCYINTVHIYADSITVKRNYIDGNYCIHLFDDADYNNIVQNYIHSSNSAMILDGNNNSINITSNFIRCNIPYRCIQTTTSSTNIIVENNVLYGELWLYNAVISNNIYRDGNLTGNASNTIVNNICNATQFDTTGNNQQNIVMSTVFVDSGSTDGQWQIDPLGPAAGTGTFGTDIGMFGGNNPYILSGIPEIPTVYYFYGPSNAAQTLQIRAKIKSRK